ncbi:MAG: NAD(P)-dependent oxidoreductase [Bilophila wadsworthia]
MELSGQSCLVVGRGAVGCRKIASLLECPIERLHVIDLAEPIQIFKCCLKINASVLRNALYTVRCGGVRLGFCRHQQQGDQ